MLLSLVALHLIAPIATAVGGQLGSGIVLLAYFAVLLAAVFSLSPSRRLIPWAITLAVLPLTMGLLGVFGVHDVPDLAVGAAMTPILLLVARLLFSHIMGPRATVASRLYAAGAVYFVIAHAWAAVYALVEMVIPSAFASAQSSGLERISWSDLLYFSLVTITTLGYGDITPVHGFARALASLEAVTGVFFMAVVVARLISASDIRVNTTDQS